MLTMDVHRRLKKGQLCIQIKFSDQGDWFDYEPVASERQGTQRMREIEESWSRLKARLRLKYGVTLRLAPAKGRA